MATYKRANDFPGCNNVKRKHITLTVSEKIEILKKMDGGATPRFIAESYGIAVRTVYDIRKSKGKLLKFYCKSDTNAGIKNRKSLHNAKSTELDAVLYEWFRQRRNDGVPISGPLLVEKAKELHNDLKVEEPCNFTSGWLKRFKERHGIRSLKTYGEKRSDTESAEGTEIIDSVMNPIDDDDIDDSEKIPLDEGLALGEKFLKFLEQQSITSQEVASEPELQNNRLIDEILRVYKKLRETFQITYKTKCKSYVENISTSVTNSISVAREEFQRENQSSSTSGGNIQHIECQNLLSDKPDEVSCPVCYTTVLRDRINGHLDKCLRLKEQPANGGKKTLPKLVYHLLSDKEIKKKLKEHGLSVTGDRQTLIRRHKNFLVLHNSNCDSLNPKSVSELVREIECQELEARLGAEQQRSQINKKSDPLVIQKEHESYVKQHQSQFNALIKDVHEREINMRQKVPDSSSSSSVCDIKPFGTVFSNIKDESGNVIGQSIFTIEEDPLQGKLPQLLPPPSTNMEKESFPVVKIKEEPSSSSEKNSPTLFSEDSLPSSLDDFNLDKTGWMHEVITFSGIPC